MTRFHALKTSYFEAYAMPIDHAKVRATRRRAAAAGRWCADAFIRLSPMFPLLRHATCRTYTAPGIDDVGRWRQAARRAARAQDRQGARPRPLRQKRTRRTRALSTPCARGRSVKHHEAPRRNARAAGRMPKATVNACPGDCDYEDGAMAREWRI